MGPQRNRDWIIDACHDDIYFFLESFFFLVEPRPIPGRKTVIPFIVWPHQRPLIDTIIDPKVWGMQDVGLEKARGEGASWCLIAIYLWRWLFFDMQQLGIVSRNELAVDNPEDLGSLGAKIDWELAKLPRWLAGKRGNPGIEGTDYSRNISKHVWMNYRNGSAIAAYAATGDLGSGNRFTAFFFDELAKFSRKEDDRAVKAVEPATNMRIFVSTYFGTTGAYYRIMKEKSSMIKIVLHWTQNPDRSVDMFRIDQQKGTLLEHDSDTAFHDEKYKNWFYKEAAPILEMRGHPLGLKKKLWSPWYVNRCLRSGMTARGIAEEYDISPEGTGARFFPPALIETLCEKTREPSFVGHIEYDREKLKITRVGKSVGGDFRMWMQHGNNQHWSPPLSNYVLGIDISSGLSGSHGSNSVISIVDRATGEKVAELASPSVSPTKLTEIAVSLCRWFKSSSNGPAYLIFEANGPGGAFRERLLDTDFRNFHWRKPWKKAGSKRTKEPGWWTTADSKHDLLSKYRYALEEGFFSNPHEVALRECLAYTIGAAGRVEYESFGLEIADPAAAGQMHGDRVIADALANYGMEELGGPAQAALMAKNTVPMSELNPPDGSFLMRRKVRERRDRLDRALE